MAKQTIEQRFWSSKVDTDGRVMPGMESLHSLAEAGEAARAAAPGAQFAPFQISGGDDVAA
jgi:hypothetical protein